jgi:hypothetical protein
LFSKEKAASVDAHGFSRIKNQHKLIQGDLHRWKSNLKFLTSLIKGYKNPEDLLGENGL